MIGVPTAHRQGVPPMKQCSEWVYIAHANSSELTLTTQGTPLYPTGTRVIARTPNGEFQATIMVGHLASQLICANELTTIDIRNPKTTDVIWLNMMILNSNRDGFRKAI